MTDFCYWFFYRLATSGDDFTPPSPVLAAAGVYNHSNPLCFDVPIIEDDFVELEECFVVSISLPPASAELAVSIIDGQESALCCIVDDDRECFM